MWLEQPFDKSCHYRNDRRYFHRAEYHDNRWTNFTGPVTLSGSPTLTTTDTLVSFSGDVSGAGALTVASGAGGVTFGSTVGSGVNITSLDTTGTTGNITLTGSLDSDGTVLFNGPVLLAADATITTSDDLDTFSSTLNNGQNL